MSRLANYSFMKIFYIGIFAMFLLLIVGYSFLSTKLYLWGLDDATEHYMQVEASSISERLQQYKKGLPLNSSKSMPLSLVQFVSEEFKNSESKSIYLGEEQFPLKFRKIFDHWDQSIEGIQVGYSEGRSHYLLRYTKTTPEIFLVHTYSDEDGSEYPHWSLSNVLLLVGIIVTSVIAFIIGIGMRLFLQPFVALNNWSKALPHEFQKNNSITQPTFAYSEANELAQSIFNALSQVQKVLNDEKLFLRMLSHELRTPLAISLGAVELLEKAVVSKSEDNMSIKKLQSIRKANETMKDYSHIILSLWRNDNRDISDDIISLRTVIDELLKVHEKSLHDKNLTTELSVKNDCFVKGNSILIKIVVGNLLKNAIQYSMEAMDATIRIILDENRIEIINQTIIKNKTKDSKPNSIYQEKYGWGIGLLLVEKIVSREGWRLELFEKDSEFKSLVHFKH